MTLDLALFEALQNHAHELTNQFDLEKYCFKQQLEFITDPNPFKLAVCSRRSGKTVSCAAHMSKVATTLENRIVLYITLSRLNAKRIVWSQLLEINTRYNLGGEVNETELSIRYPTGSTIYLTGAKDKSSIENFRGLPISLAYIDECQSFRPYIKELIDDVIGPALMDYAGTLCLIGTPGPIPAGYFYECSNNNTTWSKHEWTYWQNPHIAIKSGKTHQELFERELKRRGVSADDPTVQREWFGKWVMDTDSLLIHYKEEKNHYDELPPDNYSYILGIDIGFEDADALALVAWSDRSKTSYLVDETITNQQGLTELVNQIEDYRKKYEISKLVIDEGGLGKKLAEEMRRRFHVPVQPADKKRKIENVAFLNDSLRNGNFKARKDSRFAQDSYLVEIDYEKTTPESIKVKDTYHSDIIDSVLYAFKESPAYAYSPPPIKPKWGEPGWAEEEVSEMERAAEEHFRDLESPEHLGGL